MSKYNSVQIHLDKESGMSPKEICEKHDISLRTMYRVLSKPPEVVVEKVKGFDRVVDLIYSFAKKESGITHAEEWNIISSMLEDHSGDVRKNIRRAVRARADKDGVEVLFVPNWLSKENETSPRESLEIMLELAHELNERMRETVNDYMQRTGNTFSNDVEHALLTYAIPGYSNMPLMAYCDSIGDIVDKLEEKRSV